MDPRLSELATSESGPQAQGLLFGQPFLKELTKFVATFSGLDKAQSSLRRAFRPVFARAGRSGGRSFGRGSGQQRGQQSHQGGGGQRQQQQSSYSGSKTTFYPSRKGRGQGNKGGYGGNQGGRQDFSSTGELDSLRQCCSGGQGAICSRELAHDLKRCMDIADSSRVPHRILSPTPSRSRPFSPCFFPTRSRGDLQGNRFSSSQRGHCANDPAFTGVRQQCVSGGEERGRFSPCAQSQGIQQRGGLSTLQDGGHPSSQGSSSQGRLDGSPGFDGRLLVRSHLSASSPLSSVPMVGGVVRVHGSPVRPIVRSMVLHEAPETSYGIAASTRGAANRVSGRHSFDGSVPAATTFPFIVDNRSASVSRISSESSEISFTTHSVDRVSGFSCGLDILPASLACPEGQVYQEGIEVTVVRSERIFAVDRSDCRTISLFHSGYISRSLALLGPATAQDPALAERSSLFRPRSSVTGREVGDVVVAPSHGSLERESPVRFDSGFGVGIGCESVGLGSPLRRHDDGRPLVSGRTSPSHQLPGTSGGIFCNPQPCSSGHQLLHFAPHGQHLSGEVCEQTGGNTVETVGRDCEGFLAFLPSEEDHSYCRVSPRSPESGGRLELSPSAGLQRLAASPRVFRTLSRLWGRPWIDLFASRLNAHLPRFYSWPPDPEALATDAFLQTWPPQLCFSPVRNDPASLGQDEAVSIGDHSDSSSLEGSSVVSGPPGNELLDSVSASNEVESAVGSSAPSTSSNSVGPAPSGGVASFGERWKVPGLSGDAERFITEAWAPNTRKRYASAWRRWCDWCSERDLDPASADVSLVVNFLASIASSGSAYRTVNSFRSALSAGHDFVDGKPIGEHHLITKLLRGVRMAKPPCPKYVALWDVSVVLRFLEAWPPNASLSRKQLSAKLTMLLCLVSCKRISDVRALDLAGRSFSPEGVTFTVSRRTKTNLSTVTYPVFPQNPQLCVVRCIKDYEVSTAPFRQDLSGQLLIALQKPFKPVAPATLARWVRWLMSEAGIDVSIFGAHSARGAMASKAFHVGVSLQDIVKTADWSSDTVFKTYYFTPIVDIASVVVDKL
ncbi:uncharacterized protein LOC144762235 [Lissotriton helveticus]